MKNEFLNAVVLGDAAKVKDMLKADPALAQAKDENGVSAILKATYHRKKEVVAVLLASGIELNIFEAAATGETQALRALVERDPSLANAFAPDGFFPLGLAVFFGHRDTVEALLAAGAEVNAVTREAMKVTPLHSAAAAGETDIARLLIAHGADVNARQVDYDFTPLHEAASNGDIEFAGLLLDKGADINAKMKDGRTPLAFALERKQTEMAAFLRRRGAKE
ncbi:MAG: ankyrin repeat domain-containing protein [Blastocatellia bacterium]|nr:ankyrin repeat domain-containing protein [Blastocatellia bacterium]